MQPINNLNSDIESYIDSNTVRNKKINFLKNDQIVGSCIKSGSYWEEWMFEYIKKYYKQDTNILDCGAFIGTTSLLMSEILSNNCKIYSFEPIFYDVLFKNVIDNGLENKIEVYPCGLTNKKINLKFKKPNYMDSLNFGGTAILSEDHSSNNTINMEALDSFNFNNISLIKIDVEFMEIQVLEGAFELIKKNKPTIMLETHMIDKLLLSNIYKNMQEIGYAINYIPGGLNDYLMKVVDNYDDCEECYEFINKVNLLDKIYENKFIINFEDKNVPLEIKMYKYLDCIIFEYFWKIKEVGQNALDHIFSIIDGEKEHIHTASSEEHGKFIFKINSNNIKINHTYDWYGSKDWQTLDVVSK